MGYLSKRELKRREQQRMQKRGMLRWWHLVLIALGPSAYLITLLAGKWSDLADWYALYVYPYIAGAISWVTGLFPFSVGEICTLLLIGALLVGLVVWMIRMLLLPDRKKRLARTGLFLACVISTGYFSFVFLGGLNYRRTDWAATEGIETVARDKAELAELYDILVEQTNAAADRVPRNANEVYQNKLSFSEQSKKAKLAVDSLGKEYDSLRITVYGKPKGVFISEAMSMANITGIFWPFTVEANINTKAPAYTLPATMCHEQAHQRGFMREDEANFIAVLACLESGDPVFQYSGLMLAMVYTQNALWGADQEACTTLSGKLNSRVRADLQDEAVYWKQYEGKTAEVSQQVNNAYLQANAQPEGVRSYGRVVDLLLAYRSAAKAQGQTGLLPTD